MTRRRNPFPGVTRVTDRHGKVRWRFRRGAIDAYILAAYGSAEFRAEYEALLAGSAVARSASQAGTVAWLIEQYLGSLKFRNLSDSRRRSIRSELDWLRGQAGDLPFARLGVKHIEALMAKKAGPVAANTVKKNLSMLFNFAARKLEYKGPNPARSAEKMTTNPLGYHTWTSAEIDRFLVRHGPGTKARLVLLLSLNTGMSRTDLSRLGWQHVKDGRIAYRRAKTSVAADLPILPALAEELARVPRDRAFLITQDNKPEGYKPETLGNWFRDRCDEAGVPGSLHGLRKAGATMLANAGASDWEVAAYLAHTDTKQASTYTKTANRAKLTDSGFAKAESMSNLSRGLDNQAGKTDGKQ